MVKLKEICSSDILDYYQHLKNAYYIGHFKAIGSNEYVRHKNIIILVRRNTHPSLDANLYKLTTIIGHADTVGDQNWRHFDISIKDKYFLNLHKTKRYTLEDCLSLIGCELIGQGEKYKPTSVLEALDLYATSE